MAEQPAVKPVPDMTKHPYRVGPDPSTPPGYVLQPAIMAALGAAFANTPDLFRLGMDRDTELTPEMKRRMKRRALYGSLIGGGLGIPVAMYANKRFAAENGPKLAQVLGDRYNSELRPGPGILQRASVPFKNLAATWRNRGELQRAHDDPDYHRLHMAGGGAGPVYNAIVNPGHREGQPNIGVPGQGWMQGGTGVRDQFLGSLAVPATAALSASAPVAAGVARVAPWLGKAWKWGWRGNAAHELAKLRHVPANTRDWYAQNSELPTGQRVQSAAYRALGEVAAPVGRATSSLLTSGFGGGAARAAAGKLPLGRTLLREARRIPKYLAEIAGISYAPAVGDQVQRMAAKHTSQGLMGNEGYSGALRDLSGEFGDYGQYVSDRLPYYGEGSRWNPFRNTAKPAPASVSREYMDHLARVGETLPPEYSGNYLDHLAQGGKHLPAEAIKEYLATRNQSGTGFSEEQVREYLAGLRQTGGQ